MSDSSLTSFQSVSPETLLKSIELSVAQAGVAPQSFMPNVSAEIKKTPDPRRALTNFHRFLGSAFSVSLIREFSTQKVLLEIALSLFSQSQYLADILVRNPALFQWLVTSGTLKTTKTFEAFLAEAQKSIAPFERLEKKLDALKRFHRREMLRIGARDILREAHITTVTIELSSLADSIIDTVLSIGREEMTRNTGLNPENALAVIGLGKLGGSELNFSSDIDLMFVFGKDEEFPNATTRVRSMIEYCSRLSEFVVRRLSEHTDEGHLYRVDLRLRPDGGTGPIAMSAQAYREYYETRGEAWERQMLLKARTVAGNKTVGDTWLKSLEPFLFPRTHLVSPLKEISDMKRKIETRISGDSNIKLGSGGIRDIEFIVQALQLLNGGKTAEIRVRPTMKALTRLAEHEVISLEEKNDLAEAYEFFRVVEHRLQLLHGKQTHSLPQSAQEIERLSRCLAFRNSGDFEKTLNTKRKRVREIFDSVFQLGGKNLKGAKPDTAILLSEKIKFLDRHSATHHLAQLTKDIPSLQNPESQDTISKALRRFGAGDWAVRNLALLASRESARKNIQLAAGNQKLLELLILIASKSLRMVQTLMNVPLLFESMLIRPEEVLSESIGWKSMMDADRMTYKVFNEFRICLRFLLGRDSIDETAKALSSLADTLLLHALENNVGTKGTCLLALGKLGGEEISIGSDLDLICVYERQRSRSDIEDRLKRFLSSFGQAPGGLYEVDFRLRPEGHNAPLATELGYYDSYLESRASLWEKQSLSKARIVGGDVRVSEQLRGILEKHVWKGMAKGWTQEILRMRRKMETERAKGKPGRQLKLGKGGTADTEFLVQAIEMAYGNKKSSLRIPNTFDALRLIQRRGLFKGAPAKTIQAHYSYLRSLEMMFQLNSLTNSTEMPKEKSLLKAVSAAMGEKSIRDMETRITRIRAENRNLFLKTLQSLEK